MKKPQPKMQKMKLTQLIINKTYNLTLLLVQKNPQKIQLKIKKMMRFKKKNPLPIPVVKTTIYDLTQTLTFQTHTVIINKN